MNRKNNAQRAMTGLLDCFGEFNAANTVCKKFCAVSIRCAIEKDQNSRLEILEDLVGSEGVPVKSQ
jgi:hypothetical protein